MYQNIYRHIARYYAMLPALIMVLALTACGHDAEPADPSVDSGNNPGYSVSIRISAGNQTTTRSQLPEEPGKGYENSIDLNDLKIIVFDEKGVLKDIWFRDGTAIGDARLLQMNEPGEYLLSSKLDTERYSLSSKFKVVALANWSFHEESSPVQLLIGSTRYEELAEKAYLLNHNNPSQTWIPAENTLIPMFGLLNADISGYSKSQYSEINPMNLGVIHLLRSVVKIEVIDNSNDADVDITSVSLKKRNTRGFLTHEILEYKGNTQQVEAANIPDNPQYDDTELVFCKTDNGFVAYVPEMALGATLDERACIDVTIRHHNINEVRQLTLAPYSNGKPGLPTDDMPEWKALLRNHIYRFKIRSIPVETGLDLTVEVQPYSNVDLLPDFGLERTEDGYIVVRNSKGEVIKYIRPNGETLTFKEDNSWPYLGKFMGVFDSTKRVLVGYFDDGRSIIFNYKSDDYDPNNKLKNLESWEIYSSPNLKVDGKLIEEHLCETFCFVDYLYDEDYEEAGDGVVLKHKYTHTVLDNKGRVIEEYWYATLEDFQNHKNENATYSRKTLAEYTGKPYGDKTVKYYDDKGNLVCTLKVTGDTETYE